MNKIEFLPLSNFLKIHQEYSKMNDQMEDTCGVYALTYILRGLGYIRHGDVEICEDYLAYLAKTRISPDDDKIRREIMLKILHNEEIPEELIERSIKIMFKYDLPVTNKSEELGTSVEGVVHALDVVTNGQLIAIPIPSRDKNNVYITSEKFDELVSLLIGKIDKWKYQMILNLQTARLLNNIGTYHDMFSIVLSTNPEDMIGKNPWRVGHFISVGGFIRKSKGEIYFLLRDTYKNIGYGGYHVQPKNIIREALIRDDGREGGILLIIDKKIKKEVEKNIKDIGLKIAIWDNGSPF